MNQPHSKTIRYAVAGGCVFLVLLLLGWFVLREPPVPADDQPVEAVTAPPRVHQVARRFAPEDDADRETMTNQFAELPTTNAATLYRQAFALYDALTKEQKELIGNWRTNVDSSVAAELCEKIQPICDLVHQAATVSNCDWGVEQPITFETLLPHINPCRSMGRAAVWNAAHCRGDDLASAIDDLAAASRLGRNVSPLMIGHIVDLAIQGTVMDCVAAHASTWVDAGGPRLAELFSDFNFDEGLRRAFEQEADVANREADKLAAMPPDEAMRELKKLIDTPDENYSTKLSALLESTELSQFIAYIRQAAGLQQEYAKALELPEAEFRERLGSLQAAEEANPVVGFFTAGSGPLERTQAMTIRGAMAAAGLAVMQDGPDALQSHLDPATGQPFIYTPTSDGFELQSGYEIKGEPVKLRFK